MVWWVGGNELCKVGFGLGKVVCLLCGCVWGIGRYLSRRKNGCVMRYTGGEFRMRFQRREKEETTRSDQWALCHKLLLKGKHLGRRRNGCVMRYTGGESLIWVQRRKKDETTLYGPMSFVPQASAERVLLLYPCAPLSFIYRVRWVSPYCIGGCV